MRKKLYLSIWAIFFLILHFTSQAQTTTRQKGLITVEFNYPQGNIKLYLPNDINQGDIISGLISFEPYGKNDKQKQKSLDELLKNKLKIGNPVPGPGVKALAELYTGETVKIKTVVSAPFIVSIFDKNNKVKTTEITPGKESHGKENYCQIPTHALTGNPLTIYGPFDGDFSNTNCRLNNKSLEILAESPQETIIDYPANASGVQTLFIQENGQQKCEKKVSGVDMNLSTGKLNLQKGESTYVEVALTGLQNLPDNATLTITNITTGIVTMIGGENQVITIPPADISSTGLFTKRFNLQSIKTGTFSVDVNLDLPEPNNSNSIVTDRYIACPVANGLLLSKEECERLTQLIDQSSFSGATTTNPINISVPPAQLQTATETGNYFFRVNPVEDAEITAVMWSISSDSSSQGNLKKADTVIKENTSGLYLTNDELPSTVNNVQATVYTTAAPSFTLSSTVIKNSDDNLYDVVSSSQKIDSLERERSKAKNRATQERYKIEAAQTQRDTLTNQVARLNEQDKRSREIENELKKLDEFLDQLEPMYKDSMSLWLDSLAWLMKNNPPSDINWRERCAHLENKLIACQSEVSNLNDELNKLNNSIAEMEAERNAEFQAGFDAIKNAGYKVYGEKHTDTNGNMNPEYGTVSVSSDGQTANATPGVPANVSNEVAKHENKIKELNKAIQDAKNRKKEIENMLNNLPTQCDDLTQQLEDCRKNEANANAAYHARRDYEWELWNLCKKIMQALVQLENWCKAYSSVCNISSQLDDLARNCPPKDPQQLQQYWNSIHQIIGNKKNIEIDYSQQSESAEQQIQKKEQEINRLDSLINDSADSLWHYGTLAENLKKQAEDEAKRAQAAAENGEKERKAKLKKECEAFLQSQMKTEAEQQWLSAILQIKSAMQDMGEEVGQATKVINLLPENEKLDKLKLIAEKFSDKIGALLEPLKKFDELKEKVENMMDHMNQLMTFMDEGHTPEENAKKFGEVLNLVNEGLSQIADKFPILQFFTAYFDFLVQGYTAAISGAYKAFSDRHDAIIESNLEKLDCVGLIQQYQKTKDISKLAEWVFNKLNFGLITPRSNEEKRILIQELEKALLKKMTDCCMYWIMVPA